MVRTFLYILLWCIFPICSFAQKVKTVSGEYTYYVPDNVTKEEAYRIALQRLKTQLIADEFGTIVSQNNITAVENNNGQSDVRFKSIGGSELKGEWLETIGEPHYDTSYEQDMLVVHVSVKGKIREIVTAPVDFKVLTLRNGLDDKFESTTFRSGDDLYLSFQSPTAGYLVVYLVDADQHAFCLLPYQKMSQGNFYVEVNKKYILFSSKTASSEQNQIVDEYTMTCSHEQETNLLYVIFSPNPFVKAVDDKFKEELPRELSNEEFQKWLTHSRNKDIKMAYKIITIIVNK